MVCLCDFMEIKFIDIDLISGPSLNRGQQKEVRVRFKGKSKKTVILAWSQGDVRSCTDSIIAAWLEVSHLTSLDFTFLWY